MAELSPIEEKLAEVMGLAQAAQAATSKVGGLVDDDGIKSKLEQMNQEAAETEQRCTKLAEQLDGKKTALQDKARETKSEAQEMMNTYLGDDVDELDGFEFLIMAEAGELGHVEIVGEMNQGQGDPQIQELVDWARPVQERHLSTVRECALTLAQREIQQAAS
jgi:hypothetical protein